MINIVIPMAGAGSRFKVAGYETAKPFIKINGKMMIEHVLDSIQNSNAVYTLIIQEEFKNQYHKELEILSKNYNVNYTSVKKLTQGACCTCLSAHNIINNDNLVVFVDADNFFDNEKFNSFISDAQKRNLDGSLLTFNTDKSCFSFAKTDNKGYVIETKEKEVISNHAIVGAYLFARGKDFVKFAIDMIIYGDKTKNEYYMSNVYNWAIKGGLKIGCFDIGKTDWNCVGTPEQLREYLEKSKK